MSRHVRPAVRSPVVAALFACAIAFCATTPLHIRTAQPRRDDANPRSSLPTSPSEIARGRKRFSTPTAPHATAPRGEGGKGPTLAQPTLPRARGRRVALQDHPRRASAAPRCRGRGWRSSDVARVAAYVKSLGSRPPEIVPGDPRRGAELYAEQGRSARSATSSRGEGSAFGPDLSDIGRSAAPPTSAGRSSNPTPRCRRASTRSAPTSACRRISSTSAPSTRDGRTDRRRARQRGHVLDPDPRGAGQGAFVLQVRAGGAAQGLGQVAHAVVRGRVHDADELDDLVAYMVSLRGESRE